MKLIGALAGLTGVLALVTASAAAQLVRVELALTCACRLDGLCSLSQPSPPSAAG
jgi:hypothetical protein